MGLEQLLSDPDKIGVIGLLVFIIWALLTGNLVAGREFKREVQRGDKAEERLERAMGLAERSTQLAERK